VDAIHENVLDDPLQPWTMIVVVVVVVVVEKKRQTFVVIDFVVGLLEIANFPEY